MVGWHHQLNGHEFKQTPGDGEGQGLQRVGHDWATEHQQHHIFLKTSLLLSSSAGKESCCNARDLGLIPGLGRSPGERKGYPLHYFGLENSMDCIVHGVTKSGTGWVTFTSLTSWCHTVFQDYLVCFDPSLISTIPPKILTLFVGEWYLLESRSGWCAHCYWCHCFGASQEIEQDSIMYVYIKKTNISV